MEDPVSNPFVTEPDASPATSPPLSRTPSNTSSTAHRRSSSLLTSSSPPPTQRASFPDPAKPPRGTSRLAGPQPKTDFCCERDRQIARGDDISIVDAYKTTEGGKSSYITYVIRLGTYTTRRRYSAFLSLHQALQGLYPVLIIPPIPSKQSLTDYAVKGQSKTKEDATTIARRKRLLEDFLRRVVRHPILGGDHVFHRFLEDGVSWNEVLHSPPVSLLPKNPLHAPSHNPTFQDQDEDGESTSSTAYIAHHLLPNPSPTHPLHRPDQRFFESEQFTDKFHQHFQGNMEKVNRRVAKRWSEHATDMSELGAQWNGFSLSEKGELATAIEKVGQAVDTDYLATTELMKEWETHVTEPLHTYTQFAQLIRSRLSFRHQKHVQYELVQEALDTQRDKLELLEASERESRRLEEALERGGSFHSSAPATPNKSAPDNNEGSAGTSSTPSGSNLQPPSPRPTARRQGNSFGLLSAVKHSLSGMMDVDPEATRRANIGKTRDNISQLEDSLQASAQDLKYASTTLQADLDRFQRQKVADLKTLAIQLSTIHREWCRQNLEAWKTAQEAIRDIPDHPNVVPPAERPAEAGPSGTQTAPNLATSMDRDLPPVPDRSSESLSTQPLASPPMSSPPVGSGLNMAGSTRYGMGSMPIDSPFKESKSPLQESEHTLDESKSPQQKPERPKSPVKSGSSSPTKSPSSGIESPFKEETPTKAMSDLSIGRKSSDSNGPLGPL
ncbi:hypothetical protein CC85DRAFT_288903 [Cutaneotrichosporon oleaginosum]|uniref:PX domain-containing protein n=1 Tax=Cutaneotrichosporon oleaginosum TaxID=879819 RepID=A0A0J0XDB1_9TREE|nr:uncharacterized protein CC85DRAFT_288903 [Cutaneotrichosporon oleaginosum]KLT39075.1 hypothetical protein CC85DRAFT_288903 [Cutaneotrichosporon oleaginosum]TXT08497.1 hypothetical protein COLE_05421 [Cutaneotrichosporon oleaginosum]